MHNLGYFVDEEEAAKVAAEWRREHMPFSHDRDGQETPETDKIIILSNDKDFAQLAGLNPHGVTTELIRLSSYDTPTDRWTAQRVTEYYGCTPQQLPLAMSLAGDSADNIPGVPRIGMKTAVKHLSAAGWNLDAVTHQGIRDHRDEIAVYRQLVDLRDSPMQPPVPPVPMFLPTTPGPDPAWRALYAFTERYKLRRILNRLTSAQLW